MMTVAALLLVAGESRADERQTARLTYVHDPDIERCPSETELRDAIAARLGYDPFVPSATRDVSVRVSHRGTGIVGVLELSGPRPGKRELASPSRDCRELVDSLAVAVAIGLDPESLTRPPPAAPPEPPPAPDPLPIVAPQPEIAPDRAPPAAPAVRSSPILSAGIAGVFGETPAATLAGVLGVGMRLRAFEISLEGRATLPGSVRASGGDIGSGRAQASVYDGALVPCGHVGYFFGCALFSVGVRHAHGTDVPRAFSDDSTYVAGGVRLGAELPVRGPISIRATVDGVAPLTRSTFELAHQTVWEAPVLAVRTGIMAVARFP